MYTLKFLRKCRVCLEEKLFCKSLFEKVLENYLPSLIENLCGVELLQQDESDSVVCLECAMALIKADNIKNKFLTSDDILKKQRENMKEKFINQKKDKDIDEFIDNDYLKACIYEAQPVKSITSTKNRYRRVKIGEHAITINRKNDLHFYCDFCTFESVIVKYFRKHMMEEHNIKKPKIFKCLHCSESFEYHKTLQSHVAREHESAPPTLNYLCSDCGKAFSTPSDLRRHSYIHNRDEMPFHCEVCSKSFASQCNKKRHFVAHHSDAKFACEICEKKFGDIYVLKYHKKHVHKYAV